MKSSKELNQQQTKKSLTRQKSEIIKIEKNEEQIKKNVIKKK